jgi:phage N-6-adenine-methyltransferase
MKGANVLFKSLSDEWRTPASVYDALHAEFGFVLDPCPMRDEFWDGLFRPWQFPAFCNPPYSQISAWVKKAFEESRRGRVVLLTPSRTDTRWWHDYVMRASEIRFIRGRLRFNGSKHNAPFRSCVVVF